MLGVGAVLTGLQSVVYPFDEPRIYDERFLSDDGDIDWGYAMFGENIELGIAWSIIYHAVTYAVAVFLIRRWSRKWNAQFDNLAE